MTFFLMIDLFICTKEIIIDPQIQSHEDIHTLVKVLLQFGEDVILTCSALIELELICGSMYYL